MRRDHDVVNAACSSGRRPVAQVSALRASAEGVSYYFLKKKLVFLCGLFFILYHKAYQIPKFREVKNPTLEPGSPYSQLSREATIVFFFSCSI